MFKKDYEQIIIDCSKKDYSSFLENISKVLEIKLKSRLETEVAEIKQNYFSKKENEK